MVVRGDSGFCREELMSWCEAEGVDYLLGLAKNDRLKADIAKEMEEAKAQYQETGRAARLFKEFVYLLLPSCERLRLGSESRDSWTISSRMISESNQLAGRILGIQVDGVVAQVTMSIGRYRLTSIISSELAFDLHLKTGDMVAALVKSSQVMILRNQV
jgi:molybdopterin-binding protein